MPRPGAARDVGEFRSHRPQHRDELRIGVGVAKGVIEEVVDEVLTFDFGHLGEPMYQSDLLGCGGGLGRGAEHRATQPQGLDLVVQDLQMSGRDLGQGCLSVQ